MHFSSLLTSLALVTSVLAAPQFYVPATEAAEARAWLDLGYNIVKDRDVSLPLAESLLISRTSGEIASKVKIRARAPSGTASIVRPQRPSGTASWVRRSATATATVRPRQAPL
jgi:hypothetical protein